MKIVIKYFETFRFHMPTKKLFCYFITFAGCGFVYPIIKYSYAKI